MPGEERCEVRVWSDGGLRQCVKRWGHNAGADPCAIGNSAAAEVQRLMNRAVDRLKVAVGGLEEIERLAWARTLMEGSIELEALLESIESTAAKARAAALKLEP